MERLYALDDKFPERLDELLHQKEYVDSLRTLPEPELSQLVDHLNEIIVRLDRTGGGSSRKPLQVLRRICGSRKILPTTYELSRDLLVPDGPPKAQGGFCDAFEGTLSVKVFVKRLRINSKDEEKVKEYFCKEAVVWKHLNHPNVVPFRGITLNPPQLISEWMPGGELGQYVRSNPDADVFGLVFGTAQGLTYLHSKDVIHGDLKGPNIMIDGAGNPRITDFGLTKIARGCNSTQNTSKGHGQSLRWTAPEMFESDDTVTKESDVYSFGMVVIEVFTGEIPFKEFQGSEVVVPITRGERPGRPSHPKFTEDLWKLTQRCWTKNPKDRPAAQKVVDELKLHELPTRSEESAVNPLTLVSPEPSTGTKPPTTSTTSGEEHLLPYMVDSSNTRSEPSPSPPQKDDRDGRPGARGQAPTTKRPSLGVPSGSTKEWSEKVSDNGEDKNSQEGPAATKPKEEHGSWCKAKSMLRTLKCW